MLILSSLQTLSLSLWVPVHLWYFLPVFSINNSKKRAKKEKKRPTSQGCWPRAALENDLQNQREKKLCVWHGTFVSYFVSLFTFHLSFYCQTQNIHSGLTSLLAAECGSISAPVIWIAHYSLPISMETVLPETKNPVLRTKNRNRWWWGRVELLDQQEGAFRTHTDSAHSQQTDADMLCRSWGKLWGIWSLRQQT